MSEIPMSAPTVIPVLNEVLGELVSSIRRLLGQNFVGAYLHGSFAVGDYTSSSDVDVLIVIHRDLVQEEISSFQCLHRDLFETLPKPWGQHLELSYAPAKILKQWAVRPRDPSDYRRPDDWVDPSTNSPPRAYPFWYLDNGASRLVRSEHDNSRVVRWVVREKGIVLAGPDPKSLIEFVSANDLVLQILETLQLISAKWGTVEAMQTLGIQTFFVTLLCRSLHTLETGEITSKKAATEWALLHLNSKWHGLIKDAYAAWQGSRDGLAYPADPDDSEKTIELISYALGVAESKIL